MAKRKRKGSQQARFSKAAKKCSRLAKRKKGKLTKYQSCMRKELKK